MRVRMCTQNLLCSKSTRFSNSQLINMFETMGNDATSRLQVLKDYNTEQEYNIALGNQTVTMTSEQIQKFAAYDKATNDLALSWQKWKNEIATGTVPVLTQVVNLLARITSFKAGGGMSNVNTQMEALDYTIKQYEQTRKNWKDAGGWGEYGEEGYQKLLQQRKDLQKQIDWEKKSQQGYEENKGNIKQNLPSNSGAINSVVDQLGGKVEKAQKQVTHLKCFAIRLYRQFNKVMQKNMQLLNRKKRQLQRLTAVITSVYKNRMTLSMIKPVKTKQQKPQNQQQRSKQHLIRRMQMHGKKPS